VYPTLYHALLDLTGLDLPFLKFLNSFGFFVALAFIAASWLLSLELRRKEASGLLKTTTRAITIGEPAKPVELVAQGLIGFLLGWKGGGLVFDYAEATRAPQAFLLSGRGSYLAGVVVAVYFVWTRWKEKEKKKLKEPKQETVIVHAHQHAGTITLLAALWGLIGAKLFHWLENPREFVAFISGPSGEDIFSGLTMYGGLIVAAIMVVRYMVRHGIPAFVGMDAAAPGLMLAYAIGRIGCHVSGDGDWGIANTAPAPSWMPPWLWAYDYPNNVIKSGAQIADGGTCFSGYCTFLDPPVHPTPLYEAIVCAGLFFLLWGLRRRLAIPGLLFAAYLVLNGIERFFIEKIRVNVNVAGSWTQAEIIAVLLVLTGVGGWFWLKSGRNVHHGGTQGPEKN